MKYEEYIKAIAPFEDFRSRANNCSDDKFKYIIKNFSKIRYITMSFIKLIKTTIT